MSTLTFNVNLLPNAMAQEHYYPDSDEYATNQEEGIIIQNMKKMDIMIRTTTSLQRQY